MEFIQNKELSSTCLCPLSLLRYKSTPPLSCSVVLLSTVWAASRFFWHHHQFWSFSLFSGHNTASLMSLGHSLPFPCSQLAALTPVTGEWYSRVGDWELGAQAATWPLLTSGLVINTARCFRTILACSLLSLCMSVLVFLGACCAWWCSWPLMFQTIPIRSASCCQHHSSCWLTYPSNPSIFLWCLQDCQVMFLHETDLLLQLKSSYTGFCFPTLLRIITFSVFFNMVFLLYACNAGWGICDVILSKWSQNTHFFLTVTLLAPFHIFNFFPAFRKWLL